MLKKVIVSVPIRGLFNLTHRCKRTHRIGESL